jgi:sensor c-di-GMP phosphodiesterase-like protein
LELELGQGWLFGRPQPIERFAEQQFGDGAQAAA